MKYRTFLMIAAVVALVYALALLLVPGAMDTSYGTGPSAGEMLTDRMLGSVLLAWGLIFWMTRDMTGTSARPIIIASLVGEAVFFVVALIGTLSGVMNATGWTAVGVAFVFALGFAYFQFVAPPK